MTDTRRLIVNADDFGRSPAINTAVIRAHREGILTSASLMVNEPCCAEAVALALENPGLGVGLHLVLIGGHSALPPEKIPNLINAQGRFSDQPLAVGMKYFFRRSLRGELRAEIHEQFARFRATGLPLDHVNGHLHLHLHPVVFDILMKDAATLGIRHLRLTRDDFALSRRLASGRWLYRISHALVFRWLGARSQSELVRRGIRHADKVFGLLQDSRVDEEFILKLLPELPAGATELYSHPMQDGDQCELAALVSPRVRSLATNLGIELIRYQDL
jgi:hopanoid biosynthesis associated protein HpnK